MRLGVLGDVRQPLLDDAVERGLDLGGKSPHPRCLEVDRDARLLGESHRQTLEGRGEAEVVERFRPQLDGQPANVLECHDDAFPQVGDRLARAVVRDLVLERLQPEENRGQRLARLVVELAGEPLALLLLRRDDVAQGVAGDALRQVDGEGGTGRECLGES